MFTSSVSIDASVATSNDGYSPLSTHVDCERPSKLSFDLLTCSLGKDVVKTSPIYPKCRKCSPNVYLTHPLKLRTFLNFPFVDFRSADIKLPPPPLIQNRNFSSLQQFRFGYITVYQKLTVSSGLYRTPLTLTLGVNGTVQINIVLPT